MDQADPSSGIGRRGVSRLRVEVPARLVLLSGPVRASLRDLSRSGARFRTADPVERDSEGFFSWLDYEAFGRIVWSERSEAGMAFDTLLPEEVILQTRHRVDHGLAKSEDEIAYEKARAWFTGFR